jgi:ribosomal-protein-alanine N-acetyltransferase
MELRLAQCTIRSWRPHDSVSLVRHANNRLVWRNLRDRFPHPYTAADATDWIRRATDATPETHFAIVIDGDAIGGVGLELQTDVFRRSAEIGLWLGETYWGRGIGTEVLRAMTEYAFSSFDVCRVYAGVFAWNAASVRMLEKAGYSFEGRLRKSVTKDGQIIDLLLYAMVRE